MSHAETAMQELDYILMKVAKVRHIDNYEASVDAMPSTTDGFLSELYTGVIKNKDNGETLAVAIKKAPKAAGIFTDFADFYRNEEHFYSKIFPALDRFQKEKQLLDEFHQIPKYFFGNIEPGREHITMENIVAKGYKLSEKSGFFNNDYLDLLFKTFGKFHALSFAFKKQHPNEYNSLLTNVTDVFKNKDEEDEVYESIVKNVFAGLQVFHSAEDKRVREKLEKIRNVKKVLMDVNQYKEDYKCIIHGDCWSNNMLFKYGGSDDHPDDVKLVDFQMIRESTPVHDLSFLFYSGASEKELANLDSYLEIYYESFRNTARLLGSDPQKLYPFNVLRREWQKYGLLGVFLSFDLLVLKLIKPEKALEMRNKEEIDKEEGLKMWEKEMARIRTTKEFTKRSRDIILHAIQHQLL